jgi:hypothetical protein
VIFLSEVGRAETAVLASLAQPAEGASESSLSAQTGIALKEERKALRHQIPREIHTIETEFHDIVEESQSTTGKLANLPTNPDLATVQEARDAVVLISDQLRDIERRAIFVRQNLARWIVASAELREFPVWKVLLALDTQQIAWTVLICLLAFYNGAKYLLTTIIAPMRDAEDRSQVTPAKVEYRTMIVPHYVVSTLFWLSTGAGIYGFSGLMMQSVYKFW